MKKLKYLVLGAGPSGLSFANCLHNAGERNYLVLEAESEAGGLCRSVVVDGSPLDIGGGHFLDVRRQNVCDFVFGFMREEEWSLFTRDSRINLDGTLIGHPLESNIWQMPLDRQVNYLKSIAVAGCNMGDTMPEKFVDWIYWKLGKQIADDYMLPYNSKIFGNDLDLLGTYWLEKLPNVSFDETLLSCLEKKPYGTQPGHAKFYYPKKYGYGEVWLRMAKTIGECVKYNQVVCKIDVQTRIVTTTSGDEYQADYIITTIPWNSMEITGLEETKLLDDIRRLKHTGVEIAYFPEDQESDAQWIYVPDKDISYHRILSRKAFCPGSHGYWTETNPERTENIEKLFVYSNQYAYPLNTIDKPDIMKRLLSVMQRKMIFGLGRWGEHEHYNSDVVVDRAMKLADKIIKS